MVKAIFRNLISNAIKYTNVGGNISITAAEENRFVKIRVADNGVGITNQIKERLFKIDDFHSSPGTNNEHGTGLGLLFCKEFVDLHGGEIQVESEPGMGSIFKFTLPHYI
jgi:signal transduction histidine kinase